MVCLPSSFSGSSSGQWLLCILGMRLGMASWLWLGSASVVVAFVCFLEFPLPPLPISGSKGLSSIVFSIELTVQCDGCLIWGLGWWAGLVAGLRVGQAYGVFHRPGLGLLVSVPRSLSTQPPFATQALIKINWLSIIISDFAFLDVHCKCHWWSVSASLSGTRRKYKQAKNE